MSDIKIEVREDKSHPEGGHAIIRLNGLKAKPQSDTFIIAPADPDLSIKDIKGWPTGERTPLATKMDQAGFEIMVGPDVVESPVLLPGTPVVIKVPAAGVSGEVLWPDITPLQRPKVKRIITSTDRRDALARINAKNTKAPAAPAPAASKAPDAADSPEVAALQAAATLADVEQVNRTGINAKSTNAGLSSAAILGLGLSSQKSTGVGQGSGRIGRSAVARYYAVAAPQGEANYHVDRPARCLGQDKRQEYKSASSTSTSSFKSARRSRFT